MPFTDDYYIYTPMLHNEKYRILKCNPLLGNFTYGLEEDILNQFNLSAISFCFFIKWNNSFSDGEVDKHIWIKKGLHIPNCQNINIGLNSNFTNKFLECESLEKVIKNQNFFSSYGLKQSYAIIKDIDICDFHNVTSTTKVMIDQRYNLNSCLFERKIITFDKLKQILVRNSGRPIKMGKNLNYYETELEKLLSIHYDDNTAPFPGDCDLLLFDDEYKCQCIIEYKKRTDYGSNLTISEQSFMNYINRDRLKYMRLDIIRKYFERQKKHTIPLVIVYYSTANDDELQCIKIEEISHDFTIGKNMVFKIDSNASPANNQLLILNKIMDFI